jgi:hypothetical protein
LSAEPRSPKTNNGQEKFLKQVEAYTSDRMNRESAMKTLNIVPSRPLVSIVDLNIFSDIPVNDPDFTAYVAEASIRLLQNGSLVFEGGTAAHLERARQIVGNLQAHPRTKNKAKGELLTSSQEAGEGSFFVHLNAQDTSKDTQADSSNIHFFMQRLAKDPEQRQFMPVDAVADVMSMIGLTVKPQKDAQGNITYNVNDIPDQAVQTVNNLLRGDSGKAVTAADIVQMIMGISRAFAFRPMPVDFDRIQRFHQLMRQVDIAA